MKWEELLKKSRNLPVVQSETLLAGTSSPGSVLLQLARWHKAGKLIQLKKGTYLIAEPYRRTRPFEPFLAALLKYPSYVSLEKALSIHGLIPEGVPVVTSVTPKRPGEYRSEAGIFQYRSIQSSLFWGYQAIHKGGRPNSGQTGFLARPEKALLDLVYLNRVRHLEDYFEELRLQNLESINLNRLTNDAKRFGKKRILQAARILKSIILQHRKEEKTL